MSGLMRSETERLTEQLRLAFEGSAWHGAALAELTADVTVAEAAAHPIPGAHSIWELVLHLAGTYGLVLRRLRGDGRNLSPEEDWPSAPAPTAEQWRDALRRLRDLNSELRQAVARFEVADLDQPLVDQSPYPAYTQFIGVTQHDLYHAGQIALLKKAVRGAA